MHIFGTVYGAILVPIQFHTTHALQLFTNCTQLYLKHKSYRSLLIITFFLSQLQKVGYGKRLHQRIALV